MKKHIFTFPQTVVLSLLLIGFVVVSRFVPHLWNMTPVMAAGMCAAFYLGKRWGIVVALTAMLLSDALIGFYSLPVMLSVYGSIAVGTVLAAWLKRKSVSASILPLVSVSASVFFFLVTNAAVWAFGTMYPPTLGGLGAAYVMGLPFFKSALIGDVLFTLVIVAAFELVLYFFAHKNIKGTEAVVSYKINQQDENLATSKL